MRQAFLGPSENSHPWLPLDAGSFHEWTRRSSRRILKAVDDGWLASAFPLRSGAAWHRAPQIRFSEVQNLRSSGSQDLRLSRTQDPRSSEHEKLRTSPVQAPMKLRVPSVQEPVNSSRQQVQNSNFHLIEPGKVSLLASSGRGECILAFQIQRLRPLNREGSKSEVLTLCQTQKLPGPCSCSSSYFPRAADNFIQAGSLVPFAPLRPPAFSLTTKSRGIYINIRVSG